MKKLLRVILLYILLGIIVQFLFGSQYAILPQSFLAFLIGLFGSIGAAGLVGFLLGGLCLYIVLKKQKNK